MRFLPGAVSALALLVLAACGGQTPPPALPAPPTIKSFTAEKTRIAAGDSVTLSFTADNATSVELVDQTGTKLELTGDASAGSATVQPATSSFYVLRVKGDGGRDSAFVQVAVDEDLKEVALVAVPPQVTAGESTQLLWTTFGAKKARLQSSSGDQLELDMSKRAGVVEVTPTRTTSYVLVGTDSSGQELTSSTEVKVLPTASAFEATPMAAQPGEKISFSWKTAGASQVVLSEDTFGELNKVNAPAETAQVDRGTFEWTVPDQLPNGEAVELGLPLRFTLKVTTDNPKATLTHTLAGFVGTGPKIVDFVAPKAVTEGKPVQLSWSTLNADRVQIFVDGGLVYEPLSVPQGVLAQNSVTLVAPPADANYKVVAYGHENTRTEVQRTVRVVKAPAISSFTLPGAIGKPGDPASAEWTVTDATTVVVRVKNGPAVFTTTAKSGKTDVYPGLATTYVLEAWNDAGDVATAERKVRVGTPGNMTASPTPVTQGETIAVTWDFSQANLLQIYGDPDSAPLKTNPGNSFYDLANIPAAAEVALTDADDGVGTLALPVPFGFPFVGRVVDTFYASTNGVLAFDKPANALSANTDLTGANLPAMIAPFWDDLYLGENGKILYMVEGTTFPRRLVVQWDKVQTDDASELTFQLQLWETGEVRIAYKTLSGAGSAGDGATIGWRLNSDLALNFSRDTATLAAGDELSFFSGGAPTGAVDLVPERSGAFTLVGALPSGKYVVYTAGMNVIATDSVVINELMAFPDPTAIAGQWVELLNVSQEPIDLSGTQLVSASTATSFTLPEGLILMPGQFFTIGQSTDPLANGGASVDLEWTGLTLDAVAGDEVSLTAVNPISSLSYGTSNLVAGISVQSADPVIDTTGNQVTCTTRTKTFGGNGAIGTPGARNEGCFEYVMSPIPVQYEDISRTGTRLFTPGDDLDSVYTTVSFASNPILYFGVAQPTWTITSNGVMAAGTFSSSFTGNKAKPSSSDPKGSVGVFWDDLGEAQSQPDSNVYYGRVPATAQSPAHWIVQWHHWEYYSSTPDDDMNFQVKFFDDGVIEFHYATMSSGTSSNYASGVSATSWIENPSGTRAMVIGINSNYMTSNRAWRFTPNSQVQP